MIVISFALLINNNFGQSQIQGTVKDLKGKPLPYVNIFIENTYKGTTSNEDGQYELNISKTGNYVIVFQFLGYKTLTKELKIESLPHRLDVVMEEENIDLKEVVIDVKKILQTASLERPLQNDKFYLENSMPLQQIFIQKGLSELLMHQKNLWGKNLVILMVLWILLGQVFSICPKPCQK